MKNIIKIILCITMAAVLMLPAYAGSQASGSAETVIYLEDGGKLVVSAPVVSDAAKADATKGTSSKTAYKYATYYNSSDELEWKFTLTGTFSYNGTTSTCTAASYSQNIYNTKWSFSNGTSGRSGNTATASGTFTYKILGITVKTQNVSIQMSCDKNGNIT